MRGVLILAGVLCSSVAVAYEAVPIMSFAKPAAGGKYVLVMLHPFETEKTKALKEKYGRSGLYPADDPKNPAWLCDWKVEREQNVFVSADGVFAVRVPDGEPGLRHWLLMNDKPVPPKGAEWDKAPALFLYKNGKSFRMLALRDVFDCPRFTDRDCFMGPVVTISSFQDDLGRVTIASEADGRQQTATINFRTGEVLESGGGAVTPAPLPTGIGNAGNSTTAEGPNWGRILLIGLVIVGGCSAAFAGLAVLLVRKSARQKV